MSATERKTLVLNADGNPLGVWPLSFVSAEEAIKAVYKGTVNVLEEWPEEFHSPSTTIKIPKAVMLRTYQPVSSKPKFCRRSILLRDRFRCQYCGDKFTSDELTYDHVLPKSLGGQTTWENIVMACSPCNSAKADQMPKLSGRKGKNGTLLRPLKQPRQPSSVELLKAGLELIDPKVKEDFASFLYWSIPLEN